MVYKIPIAAMDGVTLTVDKKTKTLCFVIMMSKERQNKILVDCGWKEIKKVKRKFGVENFEIARRFLAVIQHNYILLRGSPLPVDDKVTPRDLT